jgi:hypothetical protein
MCVSQWICVSTKHNAKNHSNAATGLTINVGATK